MNKNTPHHAPITNTPVTNTQASHTPTPTAPTPDTRRTIQSSAYRQADQLPGPRPAMDAYGGKAQNAFDQNRDPYIARQLQDQGKTEAQRRREQIERETRRQNHMIKRQQPKPQLRPSPRLAYGPDGAAFNGAWRNEQRAADKDAQRRKTASNKPQSREERKAAFMNARSAAPSRGRTRNRTR